MGGILPVVASEQALREHFDASNRRDFPTAMSYYDDDVVCVAFRGIDVGSYHGIEAVGRVFGEWMSAFAGGVVFDDMVIERGRDAYAVSARMTARGRESGIELQQDWVWVYWMRSGKIVRVETHEDLELVRRIAGVEPS